MTRESTRRPSAGRAQIGKLALMALALLPAGCDRKDADAGKSPTSAPPVSQSSPAAPPAQQVQPPQPSASQPAQPPAPPPKPLTDLESLVAPIALYPDPLLAELLVASTYPLEVVQATRWLDSKPDLSTLNTKDWDASVMRLVSVPQVLKMMSDHLEWTTQLGDAFLAKPAELMDNIQVLRKRAQDSGFLKDTAQQKVAVKAVSAAMPAEDAGNAETTIQATPAVVKKEIITIEPAKSDTVYVPQYNPETVYKASMAPPPAATTASYAYPAAAAPAPAYYPAYYPPAATTTTTTTTDNTDSWINFGTGAVVGGLLTWGLMEWADDDDWDHYHGGGYYPVQHYYGGAVCNGGNCWNGGGGNYDRGNINRNTNLNRDVNISGNEINIDRGGVFSQSNLRPAQQPAAWQPDTRHRRGQKYPEALQRRLGTVEQPGLAGQRLGAAQTLPASSRGFGEAGGRPSTLPAERRTSSAEVRERLAQKPGTADRLGQQRPSTRDLQAPAGRERRENAMAGLRDSGTVAQLDSRRGAESRQRISPGGRPGGEARIDRAQREPVRQPAAERRPPQTIERRAEPRQDFAARERQQMDAQRRAERARPTAFDGGNRSAGNAQAFSQRGAQSRAASSGGGGRFGGGAASGRGGGRGGGAAGGGRGGGGGRRR